MFALCELLLRHARVFYLVAYKTKQRERKKNETKKGFCSRLPAVYGFNEETKEQRSRSNI